MKEFEQHDKLSPNNWIVVRIDGRGFHKCGPSTLMRNNQKKTNSSRFSAKYGFEKPNDIRALNLMNNAAKAVMTEISDLTIAYGVSDEFR